VDSHKTKQIFGSTKFKELSDEIRNKKTISAVFLNVGHLKTIQIAEFQGHWKIPVFDRYYVISTFIRNYFMVLVLFCSLYIYLVHMKMLYFNWMIGVYLICLILVTGDYA
jgi:hypothetical protein